MNRINNILKKEEKIQGGGGGERNDGKSYKNTNTKFLHPIINYCYCQRVKYDYLL